LNIDYLNWFMMIMIEMIWGFRFMMIMIEYC
jgi:hypothetical protein